jgi:hypothetical protein
MDLKVVKIAIGTRFKINELGAVRCPALAGKVGTVVAFGNHNTGITVLFDGARRPTCLHRDYISALRQEHRVPEGAKRSLSRRLSLMAFPALRETNAAP